MEENKKSLFIFSFKLGVFLIILFLILYFCFIPFIPDVDRDKKYVRELEKLRTDDKGYDILFLSNSFSFTAYDPTMIRNQIGLKSVHISSGAQRLKTTLIVAEEILNTNNFKYIVLDISDQTVLTPKSKEENIWHYQTLALQELPFSYNKFVNTTKYFPIKEYPEFYISALSKKTGRIFRMNDRNNYLSRNDSYSFTSNKNTVLFSYAGFLAKNHLSIKKEGFLKDFNRKAKPKLETDTLWDVNLKGMMEKFIEKVAQNNTEVILLNSLKLHRQDFNNDYIKFLKEKYYNVKFLNLNDKRQKYFLNEKSFYNSTHLNYVGSYQVTSRLIDSLSTWYDIPKLSNKPYDFNITKLIDVFLSLDNDQDKFIKLKFDDIPKVLNEYQLVIALYPKDTLLLSDYSKKKKFGSDNFYIKNPFKNNKNVGNAKVLIKKLETKITDDNLERMKIYFYKSGATLKLPSFEIDLKPLLN